MKEPIELTTQQKEFGKVMAVALKALYEEGATDPRTAVPGDRVIDLCRSRGQEAMDNVPLRHPDRSASTNSLLIAFVNAPFGNYCLRSTYWNWAQTRELCWYVERVFGDGPEHESAIVGMVHRTTPAPGFCIVEGPGPYPVDGTAYALLACGSDSFQREGVTVSFFFEPGNYVLVDESKLVRIGRKPSEEGDIQYHFVPMSAVLGRVDEVEEWVLAMRT